MNDSSLDPDTSDDNEQALHAAYQAQLLYQRPSPPTRNPASRPS
jgi:hypothetical protein